MARPYQTRAPRRLQVSVGEQSQPQLQVVAPAVVRTPGAETSPLAGLVQALGIAAPIIKDNVVGRHEQDYKEGVADEQLGKADQQYAKHHSEYARGAFETATLEQYHQAESTVSKRAAEELDHSLPIDDQVRIVDGWMKEAIGPLVTDPRARALIGERYQTFIQTAAANIQKGQLEAHAQAAQDAVTQDATVELDRTGTLNWDQHFHRLYSQTGDAARSNELLVGVVAQAIQDAAERGEDYSKLKDLIPAEVTGPDGSKLPGPLYSPKYRGIIQQAMANAEHLHDKFYEEQSATQQYHAYVDLDQDLQNSVPITMETLAAKGYKVGTKPGDTMTPSVAANYIQQSAAKIAAKKVKEDEAQQYDNARGVMGRWADVRPAVADYSEDKRNDAADAWFQRLLVGGGADMQQLGGAQMASNPSLVDTVAKLSAQEGVPYRPLKDTMSSINNAAPGDVTARLPAYQILKARGLAGMYVDDDSALVYEAALSAQAAGESKEGVNNYIRQMGDTDKKKYVSDNVRASNISKKGLMLPTGNSWFSFGAKKVNSNDTLNAAQINGRLEMLESQALAKGLSRTDAEKYAVDRVAQTHTALQINDKWVVIPNSSIPGGNGKAATEALDWYGQQLPKLSKKLDIPEDEELSIRPTYGNGRKLEFEITRAGGVEIPNTRFSIEGLMQAYYRANPQATPQGQAAERQKAEETARRNSRIYAPPMMTNRGK